MKDIYGWSRVSQGFVLGRVQLFVSTTFKANVHEHEHEASWVTSPLRSSTMVLPIIHSAQSSCGISYMAFCVCLHVCLWKTECVRFACLMMFILNFFFMCGQLYFHTSFNINLRMYLCACLCMCVHTRTRQCFNKFFYFLKQLFCYAWFYYFAHLYTFYYFFTPILFISF